MASIDPKYVKDAGHTLPSELLGYIFLEDAKDDCPFNSIERLLLVCKTWSNAATSYQKLWSTLRISPRKGYPDDLFYWANRIRKRLNRLDTDCLLGVELGGELDAVQMRHGIVSDEVAETILKLLHGENGCVAARWKWLQINSRLQWLSLPYLFVSLSYPTPQLRWIDFGELGNYNTNWDSTKLLPYTPRLESIDCDRMRAMYYPLDLSSVTTLRLRGLSQDWFDLSSIVKANKLVCLHLTNNGYHRFTLWATFSALEELRLSANIFEDTLVHFFAPKLKLLCIEPTLSFAPFLQCPGIDYRKVEIHLFIQRFGYVRQSDWIESVKKELRPCLDNSPVRKWKMINWTAIAFVELLEERWSKGLVADHPLFLQFNEHEVEIPISGVEHWDAIQRFKTIANVKKMLNEGDDDDL